VFYLGYDHLAGHHHGPHLFHKNIASSKSIRTMTPGMQRYSMHPINNISHMDQSSPLLSQVLDIT
jgi:hypothetical protein